MAGHEGRHTTTAASGQRRCGRLLPTGPGSYPPRAPSLRPLHPLTGRGPPTALPQALDSRTAEAHEALRATGAALAAREAAVAAREDELEAQLGRLQEFEQAQQVAGRWGKGWGAARGLPFGRAGAAGTSAGLAGDVDGAASGGRRRHGLIACCAFSTDWRNGCVWES